jgi:diguanylate cyclase (GGDEF)-like protein
MLVNGLKADSAYVQDRLELRQHVARTLEAQADVIVAEAVAVFPFAGVVEGDPAESAELANSILQLLIAGARDGAVDSRSGAVADLRVLATRMSLTIRPFFGLIYLIERAALDQLALDESFGATTEPWPSVSQLVRRASFDLLASVTELIAREPGEASIVDPLTTLHSKQVFLAALEKEIQRAERFRHPIALILLDVDRLGVINDKHGYGAGDRVLERIGIVVRSYFREHDWVARFGDDTFAVLLPATYSEHARQLADRVRATVEQRLELHDYRSDEQMSVTVSVGVLIADSVDQTVRAEQVMVLARAAVDRAKHAGRNRVELVDATVQRSAVTPPRDAMPMD